MSKILSYVILCLLCGLISCVTTDMATIPASFPWNACFGGAIVAAAYSVGYYTKDK